MGFLTPAAERYPILSAAAASFDNWGGAIDYPLVQQKVSNWCWAACAAMVATKKQGSPVLPCSIVRDTLGNAACCSVPTPGACDQPLALNAMTALLRRYSPVATLTRPVSHGWLVQQLHGNAAVAMWRWNDASVGVGYHYVLIAGHLPGSNEFQLHDPRFDDVSYVSFDALRTAGGSGTWEFAWTRV